MQMFLLTPMIGVVLLVLGIAGHRWRHHRRWLQRRQDAGLAWCKTLLVLIMQVQQHRGLASAVLNGDGSLIARMQGKQRDIQQLWREVSALPREFEAGREGLCADDIDLVKGRWQRLLMELPGLTAFESMTQHTALIGTLMTWLRGIGESSLAINEERAELVALLVDRLPALSEILGQTRATGSGAAAQGALNPLTRVRLNYLIQRINVLMTQTQTAVRQPRLRSAPSVNRDWRTLQARVTDLRQCLEEAIMLGRIQLPPAHYFEIATMAIDAVFALEHSVLALLMAPGPDSNTAGPRPTGYPSESQQYSMSHVS